MKKVMLGLVVILGVSFATAAQAMDIPSKKSKIPGYQLSTIDSVALRSVVSKTTKKFAGRAIVNKTKKFS
jgi:hypothetical protein